MNTCNTGGGGGGGEGGGIWECELTIDRLKMNLLRLQRRNKLCKSYCVFLGQRL